MGFAYLVHRLGAGVSASDIFCAQDAFVSIALNLGEAMAS